MARVPTIFVFVPFKEREINNPAEGNFIGVNEFQILSPRKGMWSEIDLSEMSATFLNLYDRYAPRMSTVRLLARNIARSDWGKERGLANLLAEFEHVHLFARAIIIPKQFLDALDEEVYEKTAISLRFEVPEEDAQARLADLGHSEESA